MLFVVFVFFCCVSRLFVVLLSYVVFLSWVSCGRCGGVFPSVDFVFVLVSYCYCRCFVCVWGGDASRVFVVIVVLRVCLVLVVLCYSWSVCLSCRDLLFVTLCVIVSCLLG